LWIEQRSFESEERRVKELDSRKVIPEDLRTFCCPQIAAIEAD
jgi:hypothetical protein